MASTAIHDVVDTIVANRERFEAFCYALSDDQLNRPVPGSTWIVRDFAAHLDTLDTATLNWFAAAGSDALADVSIASDGRPFDVDAFNDAQVAARRDWPLERVFAEGAENRRRLIAQLRLLTDEHIDRPMHFGGDAKRAAADVPVRLFLQGWAQHDPIHIADMMKALPELAEDAETAAWIDNVYVRGYQRAMNSETHGSA